MSRQTGPSRGAMAPQLTSNNANPYGEGAPLGDLFQVAPAPTQSYAPDLMEAFQMLKFSISKGRELNFTVGTSRDEEIAVVEAEAEEHTLLLEDATGYGYFIQSLLDAVYDSEKHIYFL
ncbi:hypothetical protein DFH08DRAFT_963442 [Mycena albidolilacea]|uniref:Uncharacterized protein n=1 Tax=Mycena albidolilacea TaxID=1033008 RepID=A0AAD7EMI0_9AGAR|nr:hypothetical protein DFH08DRAFT_963442 [Mycena albidolilacea]